MDEYVECENCGFVVLSDSNSSPKRVDACPDCGSKRFRTPAPVSA